LIGPRRSRLFIAQELALEAKAVFLKIIIHHLKFKQLCLVILALLFCDLCFGIRPVLLVSLLLDAAFNRSILLTSVAFNLDTVFLFASRSIHRLRNLRVLAFLGLVITCGRRS
jgi:hypothetical protein